MHEHRRFLLAIDDSEATERAARYLGELLGCRSDAEVRLLHVLPPMPPELLETGGAPDEASQSRMEAEQEEDQRRWVAEQRRRAEPLFERVTQILVEKGLDAERVRAHAFEAIPEDAVHQRILDAAKECGCRTVVLGRGPSSWMREILNRYTSHDVVKRAEGLTVWVVA